MVHIITDTTATLPEKVALQLGIPVIPQIINFGTDSFLEGKEIDLGTFINRLMNENELPKTAAPPPDLFVREFERLVPTGEPIICIHPSTEVSGTVRSATVAAADFPGADIRIIDTRVIAAPLAIMVILAGNWARSGVSADEIEKRLRSMIPRWRIYFMVATLEYLAKGGRIGGASALLGSVLQIKPILTLRDGRVEPFEKERTLKRARTRIQALVIEQIDHSNLAHLCVMHAAVPEEGQSLAAELGTKLHCPTPPVYNVPPAIVTHAGPGMLGVAFQVA